MERVPVPGCVTQVGCMLLLATRCVLPELIVVEPASLVVSKGDVHEELHGQDRTRNDFTFIDLCAVEVWVGWDINVVIHQTSILRSSATISVKHCAKSAGRPSDPRVESSL